MIGTVSASIRNPNTVATTSSTPRVVVQRAGGPNRVDNRMPSTSAMA